jgi:hypothetical protein
MAAQRNMPEQEQSIKVRSNELFVEETTPVAPNKPSKPFEVVLRETPAQPLSMGVRAMLWILGVIVGVLFLVALWRVTHRPQKEAPADEAPAQEAVSRAVQPSRGAGLLPI